MGVRQAAELEVGVGDTITVRAGNNTTLALEVVALLAAEGDPDTLLLPADVLAARTTEGRITQILVLGDGSIDDEELTAGLEEVAASSGGLSVADREAQLVGYDDAQGAQALATYTIVVVIATYSMISVVNALASSTISRRRELGLQRLTGLTRGQVLRMLAIEGVVVAAIGVLLGTLAAIAAIVPFSLGRAGTLYPPGSPLIFLAVVSATVALALLATLLPGWQATRRRPIEAAAPG